MDDTDEIHARIRTLWRSDCDFTGSQSLIDVEEIIHHRAMVAGETWTRLAQAGDRSSPALGFDHNAAVTAFTSV
jgi:hypothetical protein